MVDAADVNEFLRRPVGTIVIPEGEKLAVHNF